MSKELIRFIITVLVLIILIAAIIYSALVGVNLGFINISSFTDLQAQHDNIETKQNDLNQKQNSYKTTLQNLDNAKSEFSKEKAKYESISDETINIIKEATTEEEYNIEYMWVKLGNYAKIHNLSIVLVEPGGSATSGQTTSTDQTTQQTTGGATNTSTPTTGGTTNTGTNTQQSTTQTPTGSQAGTNELKVEINGSYLDVSDFIFDVENDKELKFKLDNIVMEYVSGTTIKTTFSVKNMVINK